MTDTPSCATCPTDRPAQVRLRIIPRRGVDPITDAVRRATCWPGAASPVDVPICGRPVCHDAVRRVAVSILAETALDPEAVVMRTVEDTP